MAGFKTTMRKTLTAALVAGLLTPGLAAASTVPERPGGVAMAADVLLARPFLLVSSVLGTGLFVVSLPFSVLGGNVGEAANALVMTPVKATFTRCLGCTIKHTGGE
jgi:hypothetical protein